MPELRRIILARNLHQRQLERCVGQKSRLMRGCVPKTTLQACRAAFPCSGEAFIAPLQNLAGRSSDDVYHGRADKTGTASHEYRGVLERHLLDDTEAQVINIDKLTYAASH